MPYASRVSDQSTNGGTVAPPPRGEGRADDEGIGVGERDDWARLYYNVCLIDCDSPAVLEEILATLGLNSFVICRLSERAVVVDGQRKNQIARALARRGQAYRIVDLPPASPVSSNERIAG